MRKRLSASKRLFKLVLYADLGALMFISKILLEWAPNIHLLGALTMIYTVAFGVEALIPIYVYVFMNGLFAGFSFWWIPYLYIWTILWAITMLLPKNMNAKAALPVYMAACALHGLLFGALYAPAQALMFGFNFKQTLAWIASGFWFDVIHAAGNFCFGALIYPASQFLIRMKKKYMA